MVSIQNLIQQKLLLFCCCILVACNTTTSEETQPKEDPLSSAEADQANKEAFTAVMQTHLDAVSNRDLVRLQETMSPNGNMLLIVPGSEIIDSVDGFMDYHKEWFAMPDWTFETKILNTEVGEDLGMAITEIVYREPERDGVPYFNRMIVSYVLQKIDGKWYVIKDHASSVEKSTDKKS